MSGFAANRAQTIGGAGRCLFDDYSWMRWDFKFVASNAGAAYDARAGNSKPKQFWRFARPNKAFAPAVFRKTARCGFYLEPARGSRRKR